MKIEIVLATYGENLLWAEGMESVITEYAATDDFNAGKRMTESEFRFKRKKRAYYPDFRVMNQVRVGRLATIWQQLDAANLASIECLTRELSDLISDGIDVVQKLTQLTADRDLVGHKRVRIKNNVNLCEANHYLTHIISNYDNLADITVFAQGGCQDHCKNFAQTVLGNANYDFSLLPNNGFYCRPSPANIPKPDPNPPAYRRLGSYYASRASRFWEKLTGRALVSPTPWAAGGTFMATRSAIRNNPKNWYEKIYELATEFTDSGYAIERLWASIFYPQIQQKPTERFLIILTTFNSATSVRACLQSIYRQMLFKDWALVAFDNGSVDGTYDVLSRLLPTDPDTTEDRGTLVEVGRFEDRKHPEEARREAEKMGEKFMSPHTSVLHLDGNATMEMDCG